MKALNLGPILVPAFGDGDDLVDDFSDGGNEQMRWVYPNGSILCTYSEFRDMYDIKIDSPNKAEDSQYAMESEGNLETLRKLIPVIGKWILKTAKGAE